jgi:hypothetical protein
MKRFASASLRFQNNSIGTHIKDGESLFGTIRAFLDEARGVTGNLQKRRPAAAAAARLPPPGCARSESHAHLGKS